VPNKIYELKFIPGALKEGFCGIIRYYTSSNVHVLIGDNNMSKRMTLYFHDETVYNGLLSVVGRGHISRFIENLVKPLVVKSNNTLLTGYQQMAQDQQREKEANEWVNGCIGDVANEPW